MRRPPGPLGIRKLLASVPSNMEISSDREDTNQWHSTADLWLLDCNPCGGSPDLLSWCSLTVYFRRSNWVHSSQCLTAVANSYYCWCYQPRLVTSCGGLVSVIMHKASFPYKQRTSFCRKADDVQVQILFGVYNLPDTDSMRRWIEFERVFHNSLFCDFLLFPACLPSFFFYLSFVFI